jgi:hypothetical protein
MNRGWVWKDGRLLTVTSVHIETEWDLAGRRQEAHRVVVIDESGADAACSAVSAPRRIGTPGPTFT